MSFSAFKPCFLATLATVSLLHAFPANAQHSVAGFASQAEPKSESAWGWWARAAYLYDLGYEPRLDAVMAFSTLEPGHAGYVAIVKHMVNDREIVVHLANWHEPESGGADLTAVDVSAAGDWSQVKFWYGPESGLTEQVNFVLGFLYGRTLRPGLYTQRVSHSSTY